MTKITELFITFGVQYGRDPEKHTIHPLGMTGNGYMVVEAPTYEQARAITFTLTDGQHSFDHAREDFFSDPDKVAFYYPEGELLRIAWQTPETQKVGYTPPDMPSELYNELMEYLLVQGGHRSGKTHALVLADQLKNLYGASARRRAEKEPRRRGQFDQIMDKVQDDIEGDGR